MVAVTEAAIVALIVASVRLCLCAAGSFERTGWINVTRDNRRQRHRHSVVHHRAVNQTTNQLLHRFSGRQRSTHRYAYCTTPAMVLDQSTDV